MRRIIRSINNAKIKKSAENGKDTGKEVKPCTALGVCKNGCIMNGLCEQTNVIYKATCIDENLNENYYIGETADSFKKRVGAHYTTFNRIAYKNETALAKHIWDLQSRNITYQIYWEIIDKAKSYSPGDEYCQLCIAEKTWIMKYEGIKRLNSNDELISTCRHRRKHLLGRIKNRRGRYLQVHDPNWK